MPSVLSWSSETDNAIGCEYIVMNAMPGVPLKDVWNIMTTSQHIRCIQAMSRLNVQLWRLDFPCYGSLYLSSKSPHDAVSLDDTYSIGPLCASHLWGHDSLEEPSLNNPSDPLGP